MSTFFEKLMAGGALAVMKGKQHEYAALLDKAAPQAFVEGLITLDNMLELKRTATWLRTKGCERG
ncbi:MAG: hypothetical protein Q7R39_11070 [Dehalococcoidia bacterium]|nr:hypothetical protein [Dehalococcoidia bacterium]